jgi:hypothetical protein
MAGAVGDRSSVFMRPHRSSGSCRTRPIGWPHLPDELVRIVQSRPRDGAQGFCAPVVQGFVKASRAENGCWGCRTRKIQGRRARDRRSIARLNESARFTGLVTRHSVGRRRRGSWNRPRTRTGGHDVTERTAGDSSVAPYLQIQLALCCQRQELLLPTVALLSERSGQEAGLHPHAIAVRRCDAGA